LILAFTMAMVALLCFYTGGHRSPFLTVFALFPYLALGRLQLDWGRIWIGITFLTALSVIMLSHFFPIIRASSLLEERANVYIDALIKCVVIALGASDTFRFVAHTKMIAGLLQAERDSACHSAKAKADFLAVMSHEIRTPLQGVIGWLELLLNEPGLQENPTIGQKLQYLGESSSSLREVVSNILDFSKMQEGKLILECTPFRIEETIKEVLASIPLGKKKKKLEIDILLKDDLPEFCHGPYFSIKQCLHNLISNAIKFTPQGSVTIACLKGGKSTGSEFDLDLVFSVTDTGIGIAEADQESIFTPFIQADFGISRHYGGTGLGLAIVKNLALLMGGDAWVESKLGVGSCFSFQCHVRPSSEKELDRFQELTKQQRDRSPQPRATLNPVLIVDDNKMNHLFLTAALAKLGLPFLQAWNGREAIEVFKREKVSIIFMDFHMPLMNGLEATMEIRRLVERGGDLIPIVALTGDAQRSSASSEFSDIIEKPFTIQKLSTCLRRWIKDI